MVELLELFDAELSKVSDRPEYEADFRQAMLAPQIAAMKQVFVKFLDSRPHVSIKYNGSGTVSEASATALGVAEGEEPSEELQFLSSVNNGGSIDSIVGIELKNDETEEMAYAMINLAQKSALIAHETTSDEITLSRAYEGLTAALQPFESNGNVAYFAGLFSTLLSTDRMKGVLALATTDLAYLGTSLAQEHVGERNRRLYMEQFFGEATSVLGYVPSGPSLEERTTAAAKLSDVVASITTTVGSPESLNGYVPMDSYTDLMVLVQGAQSDEAAARRVQNKYGVVADIAVRTRNGVNTLFVHTVGPDAEWDNISRFDLPRGELIPPAICHMARKALANGQIPLSDRRYQITTRALENFS